MKAADPPGWHGKLPSLGDFASRRLGADFIEPWDAWLATGLLNLRSAAPSTWLAAYLASPSWRFLLQPGVLPGAAAGGPGSQAWAGVLMPSVDRVGRYFPLTLAQPLGPGPLGLGQLQRVWRVLAAWDDLARDALHGDWSADQLEAALQQQRQAAHQPSMADALAAADAAAELPGSNGQMLPLPHAADAAMAMTAPCQLQAWHQARGCSWWQAVPDEGAARLWVARGLPTALNPLFGAPPPAP